MPHAHLLFVDFLKLSRTQRARFIAQHAPTLPLSFKRAALNARVAL